MCSIFCVLDIKSDAEALRVNALEMSGRLRHRGPDGSGIHVSDNAILVHERLAIVDVEDGAQPLYNESGTHALVVNGEIYNHRKLRDALGADFHFQTQSDSEVLLALYEKKGSAFLDELNGIFAFCLYDIEQDRYLIGRDHIGIVPLYMGWDGHGNFYIASEMKALTPLCKRVEEFPKGHFLDSQIGEPKKYYTRDWMTYCGVESSTNTSREVRQSLKQAVSRQLMSDVPFGVLLSGGLDSSVIAAITQNIVKHRAEADGNSATWWSHLHSFSIGLKDSPDLLAAQKVADYLGTNHHVICFTEQEGIDAVRDVIFHLETYDVTTIRASVPMYLMARKIKSLGIKMVLSGEGADEVFGGYLYFHKAPNAREFHEELIRKLDKLHMFDCLRANKAMAAWGVEVRVPFLDKEFLDTAMHVNPAFKEIRDGRIEKHVVREAFSAWLPSEVVWRQKEQFSDGVGYNWIDTLKNYVESRVSDRDLSNARYRFPINTPTSKEAYFYRRVFEGHFPLASAAECVPGGKSVACSTPEAIAWDKAFSLSPDPSGRAAGVHNDAYCKQTLIESGVERIAA